ncbi:MAG: hypothetical protein EBY20_00445 [Alphaproteobacteria bacterium]|nr:hypothetical protein [Alphaproteobacteria bacterium]
MVYKMDEQLQKDRNSLDKKKKEQGKYYTGIFQDDNGNPDFRGLGPILKGMLYLFLFSVILADCNIYFVFPLLLFFIGRILIAIRFYYIETLHKNGHDIYFIRMNILQNYVEGFTALFVALYLLFHNFLTKKR